MPIGFPSAPTIGQQWPTLNPTREWDGVKWVGLSEPVTTRILTLTNIMDFVVWDAGVPKLCSADVVQEYVGGTPVATAPAAFTDLQWEVIGITGGIRYSIIALPSTGGSDITAVEYTLNAGTSWIPFSSTALGNYDITGLPASLQTTQIRAVNAVGSGLGSDIKTATPAAAASTPTISDSSRAGPTGWQATLPVTPPATMANGDQLVVITYGAQPLSSTDSSGTFANITPASWAPSGINLYVSDAFATPPGAFTMTFSGSGINEAAVIAVSDVLTTAAIGHAVSTTSSFTGARDHSYTSTLADSLMVGWISFPGGTVTAPAGADAFHEWALATGGYNHAFAIVRAVAGTYAASLGADASSPSDYGWAEIGKV